LDFDSETFVTVIPILEVGKRTGASTQHGVAYRVTGNDGAYADATGALGTGSDPSAHVIAFSSKNNGQDASNDIAPTMRAMGHRDSHQNGGGQLAIAFQERGRNGGRNLEVGGDLSFALTSPNGGSRSQEKNILTSTSVRRLTPTECERLMGFFDGYTRIPLRNKKGDTTGKFANDGPRYKCLGNSIAVPVLRYIGAALDKRIKSDGS
jgi:DNA (cytosine-5)-methyltransferase 1